MANHRMDKIERMHTKPRKDVTSVTNNQEKEKNGIKTSIKEEPISSAYPVIDTDLARDNIENDLTSSDLQDL